MTALGIDYGEKRIGVAVTDELEIIASPLATIANDSGTVGELQRIVSERRIDTVVVGLPLNMDGTLGPSGKAAQAFARVLQARLTIATVDTIDERLTTVQAERAMLAHDLSRAKRARRRDEMAAQMLLQSYIDRKKRRTLSEGAL